MEWTAEKPSEPGIYWTYNGMIVRLAEVSEHWNGELYTCEFGEREYLLNDRDYYTHWMGPLLVPPKVIE